MVYFLCKASDSGRQNCCFARSLPVRGAWVEILCVSFRPTRVLSLPVRGAWVEMPCPCAWHDGRRRRSPCGERGLKSDAACKTFAVAYRRSPCGERGLKWCMVDWLDTKSRSLPVRGAWVEISLFPFLDLLHHSRSPCGERGLKSIRRAQLRFASTSLPVRGAWVEILTCPAVKFFAKVAPRAGSVG